MDSWIGTHWRAVSMLRLPGGDKAPGETFTFTAAMEAAGIVPRMWILAGNAELIPTKSVSAVKPDPLPKAEGDAGKVAPLGRREKGVADGDAGAQ